MLQKLWSFDFLEEAESVVQEFDTVSLVQTREENGFVSIQLRDLALDIAKHQASQEHETQGFFKTLVHNYGRILEVTATTVSESEDIPPAWWSCEDDGYLHNNLCRMLRNAGQNDELLWLLAQPQWIATRLVKGGVCSFEQDVEEGESVLCNSTSSPSDHVEHLDIIRKAARMSCTYVNENPCEVWFQLYGWLLLHAAQKKRTREFVLKIERVAPWPWVKASVGFLRQASNSAPEVIRSNGVVCCLRFEEQGLCFVCLTNSSMGVTRYIAATGSLSR